MDDAALPDRLAHRPAGGPLDLRPGGVAVDRHKERGLDLTPEERTARRHNRQLLVIVTVISVAILGLALLATAVYWNNEPSGPKITAPPGYKAVTDGYFTYAVPKSWATNQAFSDDAGDIDTSGPNGWAGEHRAYHLNPLSVSDVPPASLQAFGMPRPEPFHLTAGRPILVADAAAAFRYTATRPGGFQATVIHALNGRNGVDLWLMVHAPPAVTEEIVASLRA